MAFVSVQCGRTTLPPTISHLPKTFAAALAAFSPTGSSDWRRRVSFRRGKVGTTYDSSKIIFVVPKKVGNLFYD